MVSTKLSSFYSYVKDWKLSKEPNEAKEWTFIMTCSIQFINTWNWNCFCPHIKQLIPTLLFIPEVIDELLLFNRKVWLYSHAFINISLIKRTWKSNHQFRNAWTCNPNLFQLEWYQQRCVPMVLRLCHHMGSLS